MLLSFFVTFFTVIVSKDRCTFDPDSKVEMLESTSLIFSPTVTLPIGLLLDIIKSINAFLLFSINQDAEIGSAATSALMGKSFMFGFTLHKYSPKSFHAHSLGLRVRNQVAGP